MKNTISELSQIVNEYTIKIANLPDAFFSAKPIPKKWSKKEVLGHLIDSASNNLRRFICSQYESEPKIIYNQDFWVAANNYQNGRKENVIELWRLQNEQICEVLRTMSDQDANSLCNTGRDEVQLRSIAWLAEDYVKHLKHHLNQILPGSFDISYP
ncbi:MAG: DinB family protein [Bacteroidia bacterium]|nr:DinB family protein [Bacteroidia bacterium]